MSNFRMQTKLSDKPSELILQALSDLELIEQRPECEVNMGVYVNKRHIKCEMCLAGSIMYMHTPSLRKRLGVGRYNPCDYSEKVANKLRFISDFQFGCFDEAFANLGIDLPDFLPKTLSFPSYKDDKRAYKRTLKALAKKLAKRGL